MKAQNTNTELDWESRLEKLRQTRQLNTPYTHIPLKQESESFLEPAAKLSEDNRDAVMLAYLQKWQQEHNASLPDPEETVETDAMVVLQENWLNAQSSLQMGASEKHIEAQRTVWLKPKTQHVEFQNPDTPEQISEADDGENAESKTDAADEAQNQQEQPLKININILNPQAVGRREVFCISEKELSERLIKRMRPHIADAVNGMIRIAVQKQMALFTHQLQQTLNEQAPALVEDLLEHNVRKILNDLKYEMKYKR